MLFDSHAHIDDEKFDQDRDEVLKRAVENGVTRIINPGACMASSARAVLLSKQHDFVYAAVGIHPHEAQNALPDNYRQLAEWAQQDKVVAIGEIGLDYFYDFSPKEVQREVFIRHLDLARQLGKPIIIHDRDAHGDTMDIIKKEGKGLAGVFHCFSGSMEMAREVLKLGLYISVGGPVTFNKSAKLKEIVPNLPLERLLIETDCPYLTPQPFRGHRNEPQYVSLVAAEIARLRNMEPEALAEAATANTMRLFGIKG